MKRFELFFTFIQLPVDYLMLLLAGFTAYTLRFSDFVINVKPVIFIHNLTWARYWPVVLWVALGWVVIFGFSGLYSANPNRKFARDLTRIVMACSTGFAAITVYVFFTLQKFDSRFLVLAGWFLGTIYVIFGRLFLRGLKGALYRLNVGLRKTVIVGSENVARTVAQIFSSEPRLGYKVAGRFDHFDSQTATAVAEISPDELVFTDPRASEEETLSAIDFANDHHITFKYSADLFSTRSSNMAISTIAGIPIVELKRTRLSGWGRILKRTIDVLLSIFFIIILSPVYFVISLIILLETGRPIIYKNERVGQYGKKFLTLKFRSMHQKDSTGPEFGGIAALKKEAELIKTSSIKSGPVYKIKNDPRVTPFGRWLRRWSLDELPNFWNVLKGEMSLVGPRPHQPREVDKYEKHHKILLHIKPGITGLAQISGRSNLTFEEEARLDTFYIENWNIYLDIIILVKTPFVVLLRKGAL